MSEPLPPSIAYTGGEACDRCGRWDSGRGRIFTIDVPALDMEVCPFVCDVCVAALSEPSEDGDEVPDHPRWSDINQRMWDNDPSLNEPYVQDRGDR
jgi:hypothetical protein